jgi:hypothetical protein
MNQIEVIITAADKDIFTILNRQRYLAVAADLQVAAAVRKRRRMVLSPLITSGRAESVCGNIGTRVMASSDGVRIGPPAENRRWSRSAWR